METGILIGVAVVGILIAFWASMKPILNDNKVRGKVLNFDQGMKHFYFQLPGSDGELMEALRTPPEQKLLAYSLQQEDQIRFSAAEEQADYRLRFAEQEGKCYLQLGRVAEERENGNIPYLINELMIKGFGARAVDYRKVEALFTEEEKS